MAQQLFIDLDGVLADFDGHYEKLFGARPNQDTYEPSDLWDNIRKHGSFYRELPLMPDAMELWEGCKLLYPKLTVLTGIPYSIPNVVEDKVAWVAEHLGADTRVITCRSVDKCKFGIPSDILLDDRLKYSHFWKEMGGIFVLHTSVQGSLQRLASLYTRASAL